MKIKIYGHGWVGKAMKTLFPEALVQDPAQGMLCYIKCDVAFICVPTPLKDGKLDTSIVEDIVRKSEEDLIIIRSTLNPGTCDMLLKETGKHIVFQPEYLGETVNHPHTDQKARPFLIFGGTKEDIRKAIELYHLTYNSNLTIRQMSNYEAEVVKITENRAVAFKVMQMSELYDACQKAEIDYYAIRDAVYGDDMRFNLWFTFIYTDNRGFNSSKCLVKDVPAWASWAESLGSNADITKLLVEKSNELQRS